MNYDTRSIVLGSSTFMAGFLLGLGSGILLAPQSGARTRRHLRTLAEDLAEDAKDALEELMERGKRLADKYSLAKLY